MKNAWFRLYADTINNQRLGCVTEALRWRYVAMLCLHCNGDLVGKSKDEICYSLRITIDELEQTITVLKDRGLIEDDLTPTGWEKRQFISDLKDSTAAERQRRYRQKKNTEALQSSKRNVTVTSRPPESDTDTEYKKNIKKVGVMKPDDVEDDVWEDFKTLRKNKKAQITTTAISRIKSEADKAGWTLNDALKECCSRGWVGFKSDWVNKGEQNVKQTSSKTDRAKEAIMRSFADIG